MPHVLRTVPSYFPHVSGPANQARAISRGLAHYGYTTTIVTTNFGATGAPQREILDGVPVVRAASYARVMQYDIAPAAWRALRAPSAAIMHVHSYRNFLADIASFTAIQRNIPVLLHLHGTLVSYRDIAPRNRWWLYAAYDRLTRPLALLSNARIIVSTTEEAREAEGYGIERSRIHVIPMGIDPDDYSFPDVEHDPLKITFVGRLTEDRNPELLLRALGYIAHLPWLCTLVGAEIRRSYATHTGYSEKLRCLARDLGISERVTFTGQLYGEQLRREYASAGIFVYPSRYENFGQTILEACAAGCAAVTTRVGVAHDLIVDGVSGYTINAEAPEALAQQIAALLERPEQQRALGEQARALTKRGYSWNPILRRYADLYDTLLQERVPQRGVLGAQRTTGQ